MIQAGTRPAGLSSTNMGSQVRGLNPEKTEAGTRPEGLSTTNMGSQVPGLNLGKTEAGTRLEGLSTTNMWSQSEEGGYGDKAGGLILKQYGVPGAWSQPGENREAGTGPEGLSVGGRRCDAYPEWRSGSAAATLILELDGGRRGMPKSTTCGVERSDSRTSRTVQ